MRKIGGWIAGSLCVALLLVADMALTEQPWHPEGRNAFADLWLLRYDVPPSARSAIVARDRERIDSDPVAALQDNRARPMRAFKSVAAQRYSCAWSTTRA